MTTDLSRWFEQSYNYLDKDDVFFPTDDNFQVPTFNAFRAYFQGIGFSAEQAEAIAESVFSNPFSLYTSRKKDTVVFTSSEEAYGQDDFIITDDNNDVVQTYWGDDLIVTRDGADFVNAGFGNDNVFGGKGNDTINGDAGDDWLWGDAQIKVSDNTGDIMIGMGVVSAALGVFNPISLVGSLSLIAGGIFNGDNQLESEDVRNGVLYNERDRQDDIATIAFADEKGNDFINGGDGDDIIFAGRGADTVFGGAGNDIIDAGPRGEKNNRDIVVGGEGNDVFYLGSHMDGDNGTQDVGSKVEMMRFLQRYNENKLADARNLTLIDEIGGETFFGIESESPYFGITRQEIQAFVDEHAIAITGELLEAIPYFGGVLSFGWDALFDWISDSEDTSVDIVEIRDFNPSEDMLAIPLLVGQPLIYEPTINDSENLEVSLNLKFGLGNDLNGNETVSRTFAKVTLDPEWLEELGIDENNVPRTNAIWQDLLTASLNLPLVAQGTFNDPTNPTNSIVNPNTGEFEVRASGEPPELASGEGYLRLIGNSGPIVRTGTSDPDFRVMFGSSNGDVLTANGAYIVPGKEGAPDAPMGQFSRTLMGLDGDDVLFGSAFSDDIYGGDGNDVIYSFGATDFNPGGGTRREILFGDAGDDLLFAGLSPNSWYTADGGSGFDWFSFQYADDAIGLQVINDIVRGTEDTQSDSELSIYRKIEAFAGSAFGDELNFTGLNKNLHVRGGAGADTITGGTKENTLDYQGSLGKVVVNLGINKSNGGHAKGDVLIGTFTNVVGSQKNDLLKGSGLDNDMRGMGGNDVIRAYNGRDTVLGGEGNDTLDGGGLRDLLNGENGDDNIIGGRGNDTLLGEAGDDTLSGGRENDSLDGGIGDDSLSGGRGNDTLLGDDGHDTLKGGNDNDSLFGEDGRDVLSGDAGADTLDGGADDDTLDGGAGNDQLIGGDGADSIDGGFGEDTIDGGEGNDVINGNEKADVIQGGKGEDTIDGGAGNDSIEGGQDEDSILGGDGDDTLKGDQRNDTLLGGEGSDSLMGGDENDVLDGGNDNDILFGEDGNDSLQGAQGDDSLIGGRGDDTLLGGDDNDTLDGGNGNDSIEGNNGNDLINGETDRDTLRGGLGEDTIFGGRHDDEIYGGFGNDLLDGEDGDDTFVFDTDGLGDDTINGFEFSDDIIHIVAALSDTVNLTKVNDDQFLVTYGTIESIEINGDFGGKTPLLSDVIEFI